MEKKCNKCQEIKDISNYNKKCDSKDGYRTLCRECQKLTRDKVQNTITNKKWVEINREHRNAYMRDYHKANTVPKEKKKQTPDERREYNRLYWKGRRQDIVYRLRKNIQRNLTRSFKRNNIKKNTSTQITLGCSYNEFKVYIENRFESWMNWENYGKYNGTPNYGWDIDHIIPQSSATNEEGIMELNHYTNLQPLCSYTNRDLKRDTQNHSPAV